MLRPSVKSVIYTLCAIVVTSSAAVRYELSYETDAPIVYRQREPPGPAHNPRQPVRSRVPQQTSQYTGYHHEEPLVDYYAYPKYTYEYAVKDAKTGDDKDHWETRDGDKVKGIYTLMDADGTRRVVEYEADGQNGYNAVVHRIGEPRSNHVTSDFPYAGY